MKTICPNSENPQDIRGLGHCRPTKYNIEEWKCWYIVFINDDIQLWFCTDIDASYFVPAKSYSNNNNKLQIKCKNEAANNKSCYSIIIQILIVPQNVKHIMRNLRNYEVLSA